MAQTFKTLAARADWMSAPAEPTSREPIPVEAPTEAEAYGAGAPVGAGLALHHDIHIHLPTTSDVAVYTAIFRALREDLRD
jgi:hypothetical protein